MAGFPVGEPTENNAHLVVDWSVMLVLCPVSQSLSGDFTASDNEMDRRYQSPVGPAFNDRTSRRSTVGRHARQRCSAKGAAIASSVDTGFEQTFAAVRNIWRHVEVISRPYRHLHHVLHRCGAGIDLAGDGFRG
jgi:hypothetical protein